MKIQILLCYFLTAKCVDSQVDPDTYLLPLAYSHVSYQYQADSSFDFSSGPVEIDDAKWTLTDRAKDGTDGVYLNSIAPNPDQAMLRNLISYNAQAWRIELTLHATHSPLAAGEFPLFGLILHSSAALPSLGPGRTISSYSGLSFWIELRPGGSVAGYFDPTVVPSITPPKSSLSSCSACTLPISGVPSEIKIAIQSVNNRVTMSALTAYLRLPEYCFSKNFITGMMAMASSSGFQLSLAAFNTYHGTVRVSKLIFFKLDMQNAPPHPPEEPDNYLLQVPFNTMLQTAVSFNTEAHRNASVPYLYSLSGSAKITSDTNATQLSTNTSYSEGSIVSSNFIPTCPNFRIEMRLMTKDFTLSSGGGMKLVIGLMESNLVPLNLSEIYSKEATGSFQGLFLSVNLGYYPSTHLLFEKNLVSNATLANVMFSCNSSILSYYGAVNLYQWATLAFQVVDDRFTMALKLLDMPTVCYSNVPIPDLGWFMQQRLAKLQIGQYNGGNTGSIFVSELKYWCFEQESTSTATTPIATDTLTAPTATESPFANKLKTSDPETGFPMPSLITGNAIPDVELSNLTSCRNIQPSVRAPNPDNATQVFLTFTIERLLDIDDIGETIAIAGSIYLQWQVKTCSENTTAFGASDAERVIITNADDVWHPNLIFANSSDDPYLQSTPFGSDMQIMFFPTRPYRELFFYWTQVGVLKSTCELDLRKFPFDEQTCDFTFLLNEPVNFVIFGDVLIKTPIMSPNNQWQLSKATHEIGETISQMARNGISSYSLVQLHFTRNPTYQVGNLVAPCLILLAIVYGSFIMPPDDVNRPVISVTILLAFTVAQSQVTAQVPKTSQRILLSEYVMFFIGLTSSITLYQMAMIWMCKEIEAAHETYRLFTDWRHSPSMTGARAIDLAFFLIAFAMFIGINLYLLAVVS